MAESRTVRRWLTSAGLSVGQRSVTGTDEILSDVPGPHAECQPRSPDGHPRMSVAVSKQTLELQSRR